MKKAGIFFITLILVAAMATGCRRGTTNTTGTSTPATSSTAKVTTPKTTGTTKPSAGIIPSPSDVVPHPSGSTATGRGHRSPMG